MNLLSIRDGTIWVANEVCTFLAAATEWWLVPDDLDDAAKRGFARTIPSLLSAAIVYQGENRLEIPYSAFGWAEKQERDPFEPLFQWSPFVLEIEGRGTLGLENFRFEFRYTTTRGKEVFPEQKGVFLQRGGKTFRIPFGQSEAIRIIQEFNVLSPLERGAQGIYTLSKVKTLLQGTPVRYSEYLRRENSTIVERVELRFQDDPKTGLTVIPYAPGVPEAGFRDAFHKSDGKNNIYNLDENGSVLRVVVSPIIQKVLSEVKDKGTRLKGKSRLQTLANPERLLSKLAQDLGENPDGVDFSLDAYVTFGPRVLGIGMAESVVPVVKASGRDWFNDDLSPDCFGLRVSNSNGTAEELKFASFDEIRSLLSEARTAHISNEGFVTWKGRTLQASPELIESLETFAAVDKRNTPAASTQERPSRYILRTIDNLNSLDYALDLSTKSVISKLHLPDAWKSPPPLFEHQKLGLGWLQSLYRDQIWRGALLADDMGLGKTVQILNFIAWLSETGETRSDKNGHFNPVLIVCPSILFEEAWMKDMRRFAEATFEPFILLHGDTIKQYRRQNSKAGFETDAGEGLLDLDRLVRNQVVLTNYDTVRNYQFSFASINWTAVILDEAQKVKEPTSSVTRAMRTLKRNFMVASTGTPVENSLANLWCIIDLLHPSVLLGSLRDFQTEYGEIEGDTAPKAEQLRSRLGFNTSGGLVLRRKKEGTLSLKPKTIVPPIYVDLSSLQRAQYAAILKEVHESSDTEGVQEENETVRLGALMRLEAICEHPFLLRSSPTVDDIKQYLDHCPKLVELLKLLEEISKKGEKVLIFTRRLGMQSILRHVIEKTFGLTVHLINGDAPKSKNSKDSRSARIADFSNKPGFNVLILSPDVAGAGLTITAANHVVHYGRWWNPAKEAQATDRAYRIGQEKPVYVYRLICRDSTGAIQKTFDENLEEIHRDKMKLAEDFLYPVAANYTHSLVKDAFQTKMTSYSEEPIFSSSEISSIPHFEFEALAAAIFSKLQYGAILTPKCGDGGVDLIALKNNEVLLIQCKQRKEDKPFFDEEGVSEIRQGSEFYDPMMPEGLRYKQRRLIVFTNGTPTKKLLAFAKERQVEVFGQEEIRRLLEKAKITYSDIRRSERERARDLEHTENLIAKLSS